MYLNRSKESFGFIKNKNKNKNKKPIVSTNLNPKVKDRIVKYLLNKDKSSLKNKGHKME